MIKVVSYQKLINCVLFELSHYYEDLVNDNSYFLVQLFPFHLRDNESKMRSSFSKLLDYIRDNFIHTLTPLHEYILYSLLITVDEMEDIIEDDTGKNHIIVQITKKCLEKTGIKLEYEMTDLGLDFLIDNCFEDTDFLNIGYLVDSYYEKPYIIELLGIDLDDYKELMPEDIKTEYAIYQSKARSDSEVNNKNFIMKSIDTTIDKLVEVCPSLKDKFISIQENLSTQNREHWANAVHSCRRILKDLVDILYPPSNTPINVDGKKIKVGEEQYINRLIQVIESRKDSSTYKSVVGSSLKHIGKRLDSIYEAACKGTHTEVSKEEAGIYVINTYALLVDIANLI